jgi:hypothetical protein
MPYQSAFAREESRRRRLALTALRSLRSLSGLRTVESFDSPEDLASAAAGDNTSSEHAYLYGQAAFVPAGEGKAALYKVDPDLLTAAAVAIPGDAYSDAREFAFDADSLLENDDFANILDLISDSRFLDCSAGTWDPRMEDVGLALASCIPDSFPVAAPLSEIAATVLSDGPLRSKVEAQCADALATRRFAQHQLVNELMAVLKRDMRFSSASNEQLRSAAYQVIAHMSKPAVARRVWQQIGRPDTMALEPFAQDKRHMSVGDLIPSRIISGIAQRGAYLDGGRFVQASSVSVDERGRDMCPTYVNLSNIPGRNWWIYIGEQPQGWITYADDSLAAWPNGMDIVRAAVEKNGRRSNAATRIPGRATAAQQIAALSNARRHPETHKR